MKKCCQFYDTISQNKFRWIHVTTLFTTSIYAKAHYLISSEKCLIWGNSRNLKYKICNLVLDFKSSCKMIFIVSECNIKLPGEFKHTNSFMLLTATDTHIRKKTILVLTLFQSSSQIPIWGNNFQLQRIYHTLTDNFHPGDELYKSCIATLTGIVETTASVSISGPKENS